MNIKKKIRIFTIIDLLKKYIKIQNLNDFVAHFQSYS